MFFDNELLESAIDSTTEPQIVEEMVFGSPQGKKIHRELKDEVKYIDGKPGFGSRLKKGLKSDYDASLVPKIINATKKYFDLSFISSVYTVTTTTYVNGVMVTEVSYCSDCCCKKGNYIYTFSLIYNNFGATVSYFKEKSISKFKYPKEIMEYIIKNAHPDTRLFLVPAGYKNKDLGRNASRHSELMAEDIQKFVESKYKGKYSVKYNSITGTCRIILNKSMAESADLDYDEDLDGEYDEEDSISEIFFTMSGMDMITEGYKASHPIDQNDITKGGSHLAGIMNNEIKLMKEQGKEKYISKYLYGCFWMIAGQRIADQEEIKKGKKITYKPTLGTFWNISKKDNMLNAKHKANILKVIEKDTTGIENILEKLDPKNDAVLIKYYQDYAKDMEHVK